MHISTPVVPSSTEPSSITFTNPISKKRVYDCQSTTFPRSPLRNVRSKIRSAWGDLREFIGKPSEIRRLRNALPATLGSAHRAQVEKLMTHLSATGERALHTRLEKSLHILQLKQRIEKAEDDISELHKNLQYYEDQVSMLKLRIEELKQSALPDEEKMPLEVLANIDRVNNKLLLANFAPLLVSADEMRIAKLQLEMALAQLPASTVFNEARELLLSALKVFDRLLSPQVDPDQFSSIAQEGLTTLTAVKDLAAAAHERRINLARDIASKEEQMQCHQNSISKTRENLHAIEIYRDVLLKDLSNDQAALVLLPPI